MTECLSIVVNGEERSVPQPLSVQALLEHLGIAEGKVAVERNQAIVPRSRFDDIAITDGDVFEIVRFVGGG